MKKHIHPLIQVMNISDKTKAYFDKLEFCDIIEDPIIMECEANDIDEAQANCWRFSVRLDCCSKEDIRAFYQVVMAARKQYLLDNNIEQKMVFYTWYDEMSGNFYFSLIPVNWAQLPDGKELPFGATINKYNSLDEVIAQFVNDRYKGVLPLDEFTEIDPATISDDEDDDEDFVVNVWSTIL